MAAVGLNSAAVNGGP